MTQTQTPAPPREQQPGRLPRIIPVVIGIAWALALAGEVTGTGERLHHGELLEDGPAFPIALLLFLLAWQVMIAAMMLPSSIPMIRLFTAVSRSQPRHRAAMAAFLLGYALVWTMFGVWALAGDVLVHETVDAVPWLDDRAWLVSGGTLAIAGSVQFTGLTDKCLTRCRNPNSFIVRDYRRGARGALRLGWIHGLFCAGCCWALMLVMFGAGVANLWWMAALTALMVYEKTGHGGKRAVPVAGLFLLTAAALTVLHPSWLPPLFGAGQ